MSVPRLASDPVPRPTGRPAPQANQHGAAAASLVDVYDQRASATPERVALRFAAGEHAGARVTWRQLHERSHELAARFAGSGLAPGTHCGLVLEHHPLLLPTLLALWRHRCVVVPLDPLWGADLRATIAGHARLAAVAAVDETGEPGISLLPARERPQVAGGTALISYTSGSTSDPKGVLLRHRHLLHAYRAAAAGLEELTGRLPRRVGCSMRLSGLGVLGMHFLWAAVLGAEVVVLQPLSIRSAAGYFEDVAEQRIDLAYLVPPLLQLLVRVARPLPSPALQAMLTGGAPLPEATRLRFGERFGELLLNAYGLTEVAFAAFFGDRDAGGRGTARIGLPRTVEARLRGAGGEILAGTGQGELELHGPCASDGYYDNRQANAALFTEDGWVRSGDVARRDADGAYGLVGRTKWAVMKGAYTVYLNEVEDAAVGLPGVVEAVALRLELPGGGEDVGLVVHGQGRLDAGAVAAALREGLGVQRAPRQVVVTPDPLPRVGLDKVDRRAARRLWDRLIAAPSGRAGDGQ